MIYNNTFTATVIVSAPELGLALVQETKGPKNVGAVYVAYPPMSDCGIGSTPMPAYTAGTTVICARGYSNNMNIVWIVGPFNNRSDQLNSNYGHRKLYNAEQFTQSSPEAMAILRALEKMLPEGRHVWARNHANGIPGDALPGDYYILDKAGISGIMVSRMLAQLKGSSMAFVDASVEDSKVRTVGDVITHDTLTQEHVVDELYSVDNEAMSVAEAFGLQYGPVVKEDSENETLKLTDELAVPLYRYQSVGGALAQGKEELILGLPADGAKHDSQHEPPTLARKRASVSGELTSASAHSIMSVKAPYIPGIHQLGYGGKALNGMVFDDLRSPLKDMVAEPDKTDPVPERAPSLAAEDRDEEITDAAINKLVDRILTGDYKEAMLRALARHGFTISDKKAAVMDPSKLKQPGGVVYDQHYPLPDYVELMDPVTKETHRYYGTLSFISQERDGSICIRDGYGSEIRMSRGNIYISAALDVFVRPGRDFSAMVPGNLSLNSQKTFTINSSKDMYIRAVSSLKVAGATGGKGAVTVESWATSNPDGLPGLVVRSDSHLSMTAVNDLYVGRNTNTAKTKGEATSPAATGSVIVDAGLNGAVYMRGNRCTTDAYELVMGSFNQTGASVKGSAIVMSPSSIGVYANQVQMPTSLNMQIMDSPVNISVVRQGKRTKASATTSLISTLAVGDGGILTTGNLVVNGTGKFNAHNSDSSAALVARGIISTTPENAVIDPKVPRNRNFFKDTELKQQRAPMHAGESAVSIVVTASSGAYQDWYIASNRFSFPMDYNVTLDVMPGMAWQDLSRYSGYTGEPWREQYVLDIDNQPTAAYPGYSIWSQATVSARGDHRGAKLDNGGYATNTPRE